MDIEPEIGIIEIKRPNGIEIWNISFGNFSLDKLNEIFRINFWIESDEDLIKKLEDTGETSVIFEINIVQNKKPCFDTIWKYNHSINRYPEYPNYIEDKNLRYWDNFFYCEHRPLEDYEMEVIRKKEAYEIKIKGELDDPIYAKNGRAKFMITAKMNLNPNYNSYWGI